MAEIGVAYVTLAISGKGVTSGVMKELSGMNMSTVGTKLGNNLGLSISSGLKSAGASITGVGSKLTSGITKPAVAAASALAGISIGAGFKRLVDIDNATAKLSGLGHSAGSVKTIMNDALASVRGTAFGMGEAATTAAGAVAAGIKPGQELQRTLKLTADAATIAGTGMGEMGAIFNKVATSNKIQGDVIAQLSDAGIPIVQLLGKTLGKTGEEVVDLASKGKINFAQFQDAMQAGLGGAALKSGETFTGALKNMWAALGRVGANLLSGVFPQIKGIFGDITKGLSSWEDRAKSWGVTIGTVFANVVTSVRSVMTWWSNLSAGTQKFIGIAAGIAVALGPALLIIGRIVSGIGSMVVVGGTVVGALAKIGPIFALIASPIGLIVTAIAAATAGITLFLTKTQTGQTILKEIKGGILAFGSAFKAADGDITSAGFPGFLERIGATLGIAFKEIKGGVLAFGAAFKAADGDITSSGFAGFLETIGAGLGIAFKQAQAALAPLVPVIISAFGQIKSAIAPVLPVIGGAFKQIFAAIGPLIPQLAQLWMQISPVSLIFKVLTPLLPTIATLLGQVAGVVAQVVSAVAPLVAQLVSSLAPIITQLVSSILPPLIQIFQMVAPIISTVVSAIAPLITQIASLLIPIINALMPVVTTVFGVIASIITSVMQVVQGVIQVVTGIISGDWSMVWTGIQNIFSGIWNTIVNIVTGVFKIIGSVITAGLNIAKTVVTTVLGAIGGFFSTIWNGIVSRVQYAITLVAAVIRIGIGIASNTVSSVLGNIGRFFSSTWSNITGGVSGFINGFLGFFSRLPGQIQGALAGAAGWLLDVGRNIVQGLINGVGGMINSAVEAVKNVGGAMVDGIKSFLGIHSPSRVFYQFGVFTIQGLANGARKTGSQAVSAIGTVAKKVTSEATKHFTNADNLRNAANSLFRQAASSGSAGLAAAARSKLSQANSETALGRSLDATAGVISASNRQLAGLTNQRAAIVSKLKGTQTQLAEAIKTRNQQATETAGKLGGEFSLSNLVGQDAAGIQSAASNALATLKDFTTKVTQVRKLGLNASLVQQIGDLGSAKGANVAAAIAGGGKAAVAKLNASFVQIQSVAKTAGGAIADGMYGAGVASLQGLVNGMTSKIALIDRAAKTITDRMTRQVKKNLGIKSPSRVFRDQIGAMVPAGMVLGIQNGMPDVSRSLDDLAAIPQMTFRSRFDPSTLFDEGRSTGREVKVDQHFHELSSPRATAAQVIPYMLEVL